jgi:hypothetical protein
MTTKDILRFKDSTGVLKTPITKIGGGNGISITRLKDSTGVFDLDEVIIGNTTSSCEVDEDIYALLQALNDEVL